MPNLSIFIVTNPRRYSPSLLSEIAPKVFILQRNEESFEDALETDERLQAEYVDLLLDLGVFTPTDEVAPEIEYTYAPIIQHVRFRKDLEAGEPYAVNIARACAEIGLGRSRKSVRTSIAPFALTFNKSR